MHKKHANTQNKRNKCVAHMYGILILARNKRGDPHNTEANDKQWQRIEEYKIES